jgi:hypothetical protein
MLLLAVQQNGDEMTEPEFIEEIENKLRTTFKVTNIPVGTLKEFKTFCREECGDVYWVGILQLLKTKKQYEEINTQLASLQKQINDVKNQKGGRQIKTFE